jgi:predicted Zn-dependent protease with MMP-like domain
MAKPSFNQFADLLDDAVDRIPDRFLRDLSGGFNLRKETKRDDGYYILGEYVEDGLGGCFIVFYYGSFAALLANEPVTVWEAEIIDTVLHEMQHHLEAMAGRDDLAQQEMEELARALQKGE